MGKLAVVTGGTKGIGRAILEKFTSEKFDVATCSRNATELTNLKKTMELKHGIKVHVLTADLSDKTQTMKFGDFVTSLGVPVEVLVNNAGYFVPGEVLEEEEGALEDMMKANLYSAYYLTRALVPKMKVSKKGHVFNMCSIASIMAYPNGGSYAITKFALLGFSKVLRAELKKHDVRVTAVLPGATRTSSWDGVDLPDERFIKPEDVADAVFGAYALSPRSVVEEILIRPQLGDI